MKGDWPEVADVFRSYASCFLEAYPASFEQKRVLRDISRCRTAALGGHKRKCDRCDHEEISYNSCRNRHCPKCQGSARAKWLADREKELLDLPYFHVVFTLPEEIAPLALQNKRPLYELLFRAVAETLSTIARDPRHLGAEIGFLAVLHTWGQNLHHHPHIHCVIPGGGISADGTRWRACRKNFFLPVRVLSRFFRGRFLRHLCHAFEEQQLSFHGKLLELAQENRFSDLMDSLAAREWVVYAKAPFGGPRQVLKYLAGYTHRVAISNERLLSLEDERVSFRWRDYKQAWSPRTMSLDALEFIRRFLLHVLPKGFQRIRHYGFLANRLRAEKLVLCRKLLSLCQRGDLRGSRAKTSKVENTSSARWPCPICKLGALLLIVDTLEPVPILDSS